MMKHMNHRKLASDTVVRSFFTENNGIGELPQALTEAVMSEMEELSPLYKAISVVHAHSFKGRVYIIAVKDAGEWVDCGETLPDVADSAKIIGEIDGYTVGAYVEVCNDLLPGGAASISAYVLAVARALVKPLELAILNGDGYRKPRGIIPALSEDHVVPTDKNGLELYEDLVDAAALADANYLASPNEFHAVCNRKTAMRMLHASGNNDCSAYPVVFPHIMAKITLSEAMKDGEVLLGFLPVYQLYERKGVSVGIDQHPRFLFDHTIVRGTGRYDGIVLQPDAFVLVKMSELGAVEPEQLAVEPEQLDSNE